MSFRAGDEWKQYFWIKRQDFLPAMKGIQAIRTLRFPSQTGSYEYSIKAQTTLKSPKIVKTYSENHSFAPDLNHRKSRGVTSAELRQNQICTTHHKVVKHKDHWIPPCNIKGLQMNKHDTDFLFFISSGPDTLRQTGSAAICSRWRRWDSSLHVWPSK